MVKTVAESCKICLQYKRNGNPSVDVKSSTNSLLSNCSGSFKTVPSITENNVTSDCMDGFDWSNIVNSSNIPSIPLLENKTVSKLSSTVCDKKLQPIQITKNDQFPVYLIKHRNGNIKNSSELVDKIYFAMPNILTLLDKNIAVLTYHKNVANILIHHKSYTS